MRTSEEVVRALNSVDWNFPDTGTADGTVHSMHRFPGNFIPQLPKFLIQILSDVDDLVADPFAGSGTTGVEARLLGRRSVQVDNNSMAVLLARAKMDFAFSPTVRSRLSAVREHLFWPRSNGVPRLVDFVGANRSFELQQWFHPETLSELCRIYEVVLAEPAIDVRRVLLALFSDTLFACAAPGGEVTRTGKVRRHHWGWIADNVKLKNPRYHDVFSLFESRLREPNVSRDANGLTQGAYSIVRGDSRCLPLGNGVVDAVITSPPYLGMIDYARSNRLTYLWFGWSLQNEMAREIGARYKRGRKDVARDYIIDIELCMTEIKRVLKPGGYFAMIIGASRKFPEMAGNVIGRAADYFTVVWGPRDRLPSRRRVSERNRSRNPEYVCVWKNES